jgi:Capsular polysaccharide synthesis protein
MLKETPNGIPKVIWFMWLQGLDNAPMLVKKCYDSWVKYNSDWNIVLLDEENIDMYLDFHNLAIKHGNVAKQAFSDLVRINLLAQYGGVWVDATCFCCIPLDTWLNEYTESGFFAFYKPGKDRLLSSWFLACTKNCSLVSKWCDKSNEYWSNNSFSGNRNHIIIMVLTIIFGRNTDTTRFWFSFLVRKVLKAYPYFWFHYSFGRVIQKDVESRQIWEETKKYTAAIPHTVLYSGLLQPLSEEIKQHIDGKQSPLYKLSWKYNVDKYKEGCTLHYLLESTL